MKNFFHSQTATLFIAKTTGYKYIKCPKNNYNHVIECYIHKIQKTRFSMAIMTVSIHIDALIIYFYLRVRLTSVFVWSIDFTSIWLMTTNIGVRWYFFRVLLLIDIHEFNVEAQTMEMTNKFLKNEIELRKFVMHLFYLHPYTVF